MFSFSIVIPIYNRLPVTKDGLKSLYDALGYYSTNGEGACAFEVIVVDDGSTDGSSAWIAENHPSIHLLQGGDLWWTGAINMGARFAVEQLKAQYVILWNDDTLCETAFFVRLEKILMLSPEYRTAILASKVFWQDEPDVLFNFGGSFDRRTGRKRVIGYNEVDKGEKYQKITQVDWSGGMGTIIPVAILLAVDYFDSRNFPQYHGDSDFFLRAQLKNYKAFAVPDLKIWNNRETSGVKKFRNLSELRKALYSNRSNYNLKQNYVFNQRHSNSLGSWFTLIHAYALFIGSSVKKIVRS